MNTNLVSFKFPVKIVLNKSQITAQEQDTVEFISQHYDKIISVLFYPDPVLAEEIAHEAEANGIIALDPATLLSGNFARCGVCGSDIVPRPLPEYCSCIYGCDTCGKVKDLERFIAECIMCIHQYMQFVEVDESICIGCKKEQLRKNTVDFDFILENAQKLRGE